jgi:hypothetical protein
MSLRETCEKKMQAQLNELKAEIAELKKNPSTSSSGTLCANWLNRSLHPETASLSTPVLASISIGPSMKKVS